MMTSAGNGAALRWGFWSPRDTEWAARATATFNNWKDICVGAECGEAGPASLAAPSLAGTVPRIVHHIYLGGSLPKPFQRLRETWKTMHPEWLFMFWGDDEVKALPLFNVDKFKRAKNPGEQSDILRYELLFLYGGVYVDVDMLCVAPIDRLARTTSFFAGQSNTAVWELNNAVIGCAPGHPLLAALMDDILGSTAAAAAACGSDLHMATVAATGPGCFSRVVMDALCGEGLPAVSAAVQEWAATARAQLRVADVPRCAAAVTSPAVILPVPYFYPLPNSVRVDPPALATDDSVLRDWCAAAGACDPVAAYGIEVARVLQPSTLAVHYWARSWQRPSAKTCVMP